MREVEDSRSSGSEISVHYMFNRKWFPGHAPTLDLPQMKVSDDPKTLLQADCVIMHLPSLLSSNPPEVITGLRNVAPARQVWIAYSMESAANYPMLGDRSFLAHFDGEFSFRQSADVWTPYIPREFQDQVEAKRRWFLRGKCCSFISSRFNASGRQEYLRELMAHLPVASYGRYLRNRRIWFDRGRSSKLAISSRFDFTLAFENSIETDYVTEKFYDPLLAGSVPVYLGAPNIDEFAPGEHSYINANDFPDPAELARFLKEADVARYHAWRKHPLPAAFLQKLAILQSPAEVRMAKFIAQAVAARAQALRQRSRV